MSGLHDFGYDIHDYTRELTRPHIHREPYVAKQGGTTWTRHHTVDVPSLVDQLLVAIPSSSDSPGSGGFRSQPAAHLEALDTLAHIDLESSRWVRELGEHDPVDSIDKRTGLTIRGSGTKTCIQILHTLHAGMNGHDDAQAIRAIEHDVRRWWTQARIVSGWDSAAWRPDNTCLACSKRGGLRVRLATRSALCIECRQTWHAETIGLLAEHIRAENGNDTSDDEVA